MFWIDIYQMNMFLEKLNYKIMKKKQNQALYDVLTNAADLIKSQKYSYLPSDYRKVDYPDSEYLNACDEAFRLIESLANEYNCCKKCVCYMTDDSSDVKECMFAYIMNDKIKERFCDKDQPKSE